MKQKLLYIALTLEAAFCVVFCLLQASAGEVFAAVTAFPFEQLGILLRALALTGRVGGAVSTALYLVICALPLTLVLPGKRKLHIEDALPVVASLVVLWVMYLMMNPARIEALFYDRTVGCAVLGLTIWSLLLGYVVLRMLRTLSGRGGLRFVPLLKALLCALAALFVLSVFGAEFGSLLAAFKKLQEGNTGYTGSLTPSYIFIGLRYIASVLPELLNVVSVMLVLRLLDSAAEDRYSEATLEAAKKLSRWCIVALAAVVTAELSVNLLQLVFVKKLLVIDSHLSLPVGSVLFVLALLLFARLVEENRELKSDNDLFI